MSLLVHTFVLDADGTWELLEDPPGGLTLAGFESTRGKLWGSTGMRALGARFFPRLDGDDLHVQPEEVEDFLAECEAVPPHLAALAEHSGCTEEYVTARFGNIVAAARRAEEVGGGVLVR
ncbi:hypothetical protein [Streptomyces sp. CC208A]|uniref:hypothetical protein n=1 Tax=Streptomyces sp. CC208A TaxID=3044573 RepID=UPI0024A90D87|nr:hypothetical protein [Streptomyces sp. CC208A]